MTRVNNNSVVHKIAIKGCKFKVGDSVKLIRPLDVKYSGHRKRVTFSKGTKFVIGDIKPRYKNITVGKDEAYELYSFTLVDDANNAVDVVGQYMFDKDVAVTHSSKLRKLKKTCSRYRCIIGARTLLNIALLLGAIVVIIFGMTKDLMNNSFETFNIGYTITAISLFTVFIALYIFENIKYPKGLERTLMDKAKTESKLVYCEYDYDSMAVLN